MEFLDELSPYPLREEQREIIKSLVSGHNVFGISPTGFGKSLCFGLLPAVMNKVCDKLFTKYISTQVSV